MPRRLLAVLAAATCLTALTSPAGAAWTPSPVTLSAPGASADDPRTAVGPAGHVATVWRRLDAAGDWRVQLRVRSEDGATGPSQTLSPAGASALAPDVTVDGSGRVVAVWSQEDASGSHVVLGRTRSADGRLSSFHRMSVGVGDGPSARPADPQVEVGPDGAAVVAWQAAFGSSYRAVTRTIAAAGTVATAWQTLSRDGLRPDPVALGVDASGGVLATWTRDDGAGSRIEVRRRAADGTLGPLKVLTAVGQDVSAPAVAVAPDGDAVVAWARENSSYTSLHARSVAASGVLGVATKISLSTHDVAADPATGWGELGVSDEGAAVLAWQQDGWCCDTDIAVRGLSADGVLSPVSFGGTGAHARQPQLVVGPAGDAIVSFTQLDDGFWERIVVQTRSVEGVLGPVETISPRGRDAFSSDLALNDAGLSALTWLREDGTAEPTCCDRVQLAVGP